MAMIRTKVYEFKFLLSQRVRPCLMLRLVVTTVTVCVLPP
jgi:hypothetical protein